ncbi:uncharacterized protein LOC131643955 isoform X2 [Vicia villosa]|uniref:uncharacterized protein LOC131643955 isoform X2 n=1 Tax=Vicia villosa TaxID=3911 RepID=UPI00273B3572|nr:uncharacterized protein LOC131643955 isoform X2 [Vicia villosa]
MDSKKCRPSKVVASSKNVVPLSVPNQEDEMARSIKDMVAVKSDVDIDLREVYFLILHFLSAGPCQRSFVQLRNELLEHRLLPRRYHARFSRSGEPGEDDAADDDHDGISLPLDYNNLMDRYPHIAKDHLVKLMKQLMPSTAHPLDGKHGGSSPNAADVPTLLGDGSFSLLDIDRKTTAKQVKRPPLYMRWPHLKANQVQGLSLREIGGGFTKHHRAPSVQSACYAIAKPSTMVQKMQNIKKLRGHRVAVYCAILDGSGRYVISGSDDRLVKIWSMETAFCLASCRGHDGDITDLAVSSNNALVASASNDYSIRVWRLPDGMPISVLRGHGGAVNTIAFSPRPNAVYQLLSSSDDGTCRIWDARNSQNPCIYVPRPSDAITGKGNASSANLPSSSNAQPELQILCCAYNANGTVFVTGSSDTFARVWSAPKPNTDNSELPIHELDLLSGHENDVNYVQFSGCAVSSKTWTSDSWKEENTLKFRNFWYSHDNIVTCSRDGSAIIWIPRSRRSHGKVGRWIRAYHLKVPTPPLPPQPPRGGPRQRVLPTPRGVNMIVWSLDNRFVLAAIMDCRICVWNAVDGSLVHSLTGHTESSYVLDVHPFNPRIAMSAGYDGRTIVWDIWEGIPIRTYEIGRYRLVDGKFSPDGTSIVLSDDVGQIYFLSTGQGESQKDAKYDQFFLGDYRPLIQDTQGNILDQETQLPPHRRNIQEPLCDSSMIPYPEPYQSQFQRRRLGALGIEWRPSLIKYAIGPDFSVGQDYQVIPLADLEGVLDPQPEFLDALLWEPEYDIASDDNDSEYNVNEDNSSAAEQGTISAISSSDLECSESDSNNRDGLRRSRRKSHNIGVEGMTSGRRVRKRNLEECNGNTSGNNRVKKSKVSSKSAKRKSSKAKTSRPRRIAAHNARNMLSHIDETSTEGEDNYSEDESSDSFQDSENHSEPERKVHTKREEPKKAPLEKSANASKPPPNSEAQSTLESRPRLVLKFSLSKKNVPLEDARFARENQADRVCQSSTPQSLENVLKTSPDTHGTSDATNANLPESHTYDLSRSGDALLTDTEINGHPEFSATGKSEHMNSELKTDSSMVNIELSDFDNTPKFSSLESWGLDNHQPVADGPIASGYDKLNGGYKGQSRSDKCTEDSQENNGVVHSSHSQDLKMKAPLKPTKIVIKKKQPLEDIEGPDRLPEAQEGGDGRSTSYPQLLNSYSNQRSYNPVHERNKSYKREPNPNGFGFDLEENASVYSNQHSLGVDLSNVGSDPIRRTRSIRMKRTYEEPDALNERIKIRGGQSSRGTSSREGSSIKVSDELHQRTRSARNKSDEYIANDPGILAQSMPNYHGKKLSWLMLSAEHDEGYRYIPQLGDEVVYLRQGHEEYTTPCPSSEPGPWRSFQGLRAVETCKVEKLEYAEVPGSGDSCCKLRLRFVDPSSHVFKKSFKLTLPELNDFSDFVIEKTFYDAVMKRNWSPEEKCRVWWRNPDGNGGSWWDGQIVTVKAKSDVFPDSPWDRFEVNYNTDPTENQRHSPWELNDPEMQREHPHIDPEIRDKLLSYFTKLYHRDKYDIQALNRVAAKLDFSNRFPVQFYPELIQLRLKNNYYRSVESVKHDITVMLSNAQDYFTITKNDKLQGKVKRISEWFRRKLERI